MPNPNFVKMIKLGEWLEYYLAPDTPYWTYQNLVNNFIEVYNVDFKLSDNDITIEALKLIGDENPPKKNYISNI